LIVSECSFRKIEQDELNEKLRELRIYGYTIVKEFISNPLAEELLERVKKLETTRENTQFLGRPERDAADRLVYNLQNKDKLFIDILEDEFTKKVLIENLNDPYYRFLPESEPNYILSYFNARSSGSRLDLHIDSYLPAPGEKTWAMQIVYLLDDMTESNGCTIVVPGSHLSGRYSDRDLTKFVSVTAKRGDLVVWDSRLWHGTHENVDKSSRWALIATFSSWWVKPSMDIPRGLPEEIYKQLTLPQKRMLGFCSIPPVTENERINTKTGYDDLLPCVADYYRFK
jgi:ectoine hydroxylase-related dioxygenase (phytanoyl-CoA dioxygenase family)